MWCENVRFCFWANARENHGQDRSREKLSDRAARSAGGGSRAALRPGRAVAGPWTLRGCRQQSICQPTDGDRAGPDPAHVPRVPANVPGHGARAHAGKRTEPPRLRPTATATATGADQLPLGVTGCHWGQPTATGYATGVAPHERGLRKSVTVGGDKAGARPHQTAFLGHRPCQPAGPAHPRPRAPPESSRRESRRPIDPGRRGGGCAGRLRCSPVSAVRWNCVTPRRRVRET